MKCKLKWNSLSLDQWRMRFQHIEYTTLPQCYEYGLAMASLKAQRPRWGLILIDEEEAGLVQILEVSLLGRMIHGVILDRGPLWFEGFGTQTHLQVFFKQFNQEFPRRPGRKRRIIPEIDKTKQVIKNIDLYGLNLLARPAYQTLWLDLTVNNELLRKNLQQKWRNQLNKAEKQNLSIEMGATPNELMRFLQGYRQDIQNKNYLNISPNALPRFIKPFINGHNAQIFLATCHGQDVAGALILTHGRSATWQVGWITQQGRDRCANHLLLWTIMTSLKERNIATFDLGGINEQYAKGIHHFKSGTNARLSTLIGFFS